jgi:hypothetical protein
MLGAREHADVGPGTKNPFFSGAQYNYMYLGMLEAQPLHRIMQFDINTKIVRIQLQIVTGKQAGILGYVED